MIRVLLADDHKIFREGLSSLLEKAREIEVVGQAENGRQAVALVAELRPDVVVMDVAMADLNGIEATQQIVSSGSRTGVLGLSMHADQRFVTAMLRAGASGYLLKDCAFHELVLAIQTVSQGEKYLSPSIASVVIDGYVRATEASEESLRHLLTPREREVLQLIAEGCATKQIAGRLEVSVKTIETHRRQIMEKLGIDTVAGLTKYAVREGITSLEP